MATEKFTNFDFFFQMHTDMTAVTTEPKEIVSNKVKDT